jgi:hypothetical protein
MKRAVAVATVLVGLLGLADRLDPVRAGLSGVYFPNLTWSDPPSVSALDPQPSTARLADAWHGAPPRQFSAAWTGWFIVVNEGSYTFATISHAGSWVYVDGELLVDNGGPRTLSRGATGSRGLTRGVHAIHVRYAGDGAPFDLRVLWARAGQPLDLMPAWALTPRRVGVTGFALSVALRRSLAGAEWLWVSVFVLWALASAWSAWTRLQSWLELQGVWPALKWVLAGSLILNLVGIWWGLPGGSWAPDELVPALVQEAAARHFAHGWFDRYPPFHYYVLTVAFSPLLLLEWLGRIDLSAPAPYAMLAVIGRLVSIAAALGTLIAAFAAGARAFGTRAGVFAAAMLALVTPFVYYAKTANLDAPYLFWFALSLWFYLRVLEDQQLSDFIGFAACATFAICTKDQAYGLYLAAPFVILHRMWRVNHTAGEPRPLMQALLDPRLATAGLVGIGLFVAGHNLLFNISGFEAHVRYITGAGSETYRDFEPTAAGRVALLRQSVDLVRVAWGWPMFLVSIGGVIIATADARYRRVALWLALPVVSYYLGFINVVLYTYDRFMLPVCFVLSLFGGLACDQLLSSRASGRTWRIAGLGAVFACTTLYAATVDMLMLRDSRYAVEQWIAERVRPAELVGFVFPLQYYPRLDRFPLKEIADAGQLARDRPTYFVVNADYARAEPADSEIGRLLAGLRSGALGYRLAFQYREPGPWPWLPGAPRDLVGNRLETRITSVLRYVNSQFEVFKRGS